MAEILKTVRDKTEKTWTFFKKVLGMMMVWGLIFSLVTIGDLRVGFDYDDTLVFSTPAFSRAFGSGVQPFSPDFWETVNTSYDLEKRKLLANALAWGFRLLGFKVGVISSRQPNGGEALKKEWRFLVSDFVFAGSSANKHLYLKKGHYVLFFGDSDSDIAEGRKARVLALRVRRHPDSSYKEDYHPGTLRELVLPLSEY